MLEPLESRLLRSASLSNGTLTVEGTISADQILIRRTTEKGNDLLVAQINGKDQKFARADVKSLIINAQGGNDFVNLISADMGATVYCGNGDDRVLGGVGPDLMVGGSGRDTLEAESANATLMGGRGNDHLIGLRDSVSHGFETDTLRLPCTAFGGAGDDLIEGSDGNDYLSGDEGNDTIHGNGGNDSLLGAAGDDQITDTDGHDTLRGGPGDDDLEAFGHNDKFIGGGGIDQINRDPGFIAG